jgi:hypothetical protein
MPPSSTTAKRFAWPPVTIGWAVDHVADNDPPEQRKPDLALRNR